MIQQDYPSVRIGVIGGSGLYDIDGISDIKEIDMDTPFGNPSDSYITGRLNGTGVAFLPRHGRGHTLLPSEVNYRANIYGFKVLGVTHILAVSAVGSLREELKPRDIVIPDQIVDRTFQRPSTFFGNGVVAHVPFAEPFCAELSDKVYDTAVSCGATVHRGGTLVTMEGPAFSTRAESNLYRQWGMDIIGMTTLQEAKLSREAEICYTAMSMVTDYDCWKEDEADVSVEAVIAVLNQNVSMAREIVGELVPKIGNPRNCGCGESLKNAIMTAPDLIPPTVRKDLNPLIGKYMPE